MKYVTTIRFIDWVDGSVDGYNTLEELKKARVDDAADKFSVDWKIK